MSALADQKCQACSKQTPPLTGEEESRMREEVPEWELHAHRLRRKFRFADFATAMRFANEMARIAEHEGHHPVFTVCIRDVEVAIWTHAIDALSQNDFILAAKYDRAAAAL